MGKFTEWHNTRATTTCCHKHESISTDEPTTGGVLVAPGTGSMDLLFILIELLVLILSLVVTRGQSTSICPFIVDCTVSTATAQALHHVSIAPSSYATYNLVLGLLQSLVFLSIGGFIFWRKSSEPIALVASFFFVSIGLAPFFP